MLNAEISNDALTKDIFPPVRRPAHVRVITPVLNGGEFLSQAIESIVAQTYPHWDYVILDNRSDDATAAIAQGFAEKDPRIRVATNPERLSLIDNWNRAMALGVNEDVDYVKVLHADDWLHPDCLAQMVAVAEQERDVAIVSALIEEGSVVTGKGLPLDQQIFDGPNVCRDVLREKLYVFGSPSALLLRASAVRQRLPYFYDPLYLHADFEACYGVLKSAKLGFVHSVLSYRRLHEKSVSETFAGRLNTHALERVTLLWRHGPNFLEPSEYAALAREHFDTYRRGLVRRVLTGRGRSYWRHHRDQLRGFGYKLGWRDFAAGIASQTVMVFTHPCRTVARLQRHIIRRFEPAKA